MSNSKWKQCELLLQNAAKNNILPLTSICNVSCVFCSHKQNPPGLGVIGIPPLDFNVVERLLHCINPLAPLVIGESVTKIMEGEPFTHPEFRKILDYIRCRFPDMPIKITTNGNLLDKQWIGFLASLGKVSIHLSINSASVANRFLLMKDSLADQAVRAPALLQEYGIVYHGSMVAMPHLVGWSDMADTILMLSRRGAETLRIFLPGYTRFSPPVLANFQGKEKDLLLFVKTMRELVPLPMNAEPAMLKDLTAEITGVIKGSPAHLAGIQSRDIIHLVGIQTPLCRVDAFTLIQEAGHVVLGLERLGESKQVILEKEPGQRSGLVMDYDLEPNILLKIRRRIKKQWRQKPSKGKILLLASALGENVLRAGVKALLQEFDIQVQAVRNHFFGGSIGCAGLLTVDDILFTLQTQESYPDLVILPSLSFDPLGLDIAGGSYDKIQEFCEEQKIALDVI